MCCVGLTGVVVDLWNAVLDSPTAGIYIRAGGDW